jgi:hypothetical protein
MIFLDKRSIWINTSKHAVWTTNWRNRPKCKISRIKENNKKSLIWSIKNFLIDILYFMNLNGKYGSMEGQIYKL